MAGRERNRVVAVLVAILAVALVVYGCIALLAPLPATAGKAVALSPETTPTAPPTLPTAGSSGVVLSAADAPVAGGSPDQLPIAAIAKVVTALVVLDHAPLEAGRAGPSIPVTADDYASYVKYQAAGTRAIRVVTGDTWTEREALQAMLIASSNNHAEMVARWAFGSIDNYLTAARAWLAENDLESVSVADATGLSEESVGSGGDLARIAALAMADPFIAETVTTPQVTTTRGGVFDNTISYQGSSGVLGISRSYTDEAGVCLLFALPVAAAGQETTVYGAIVGEPSYEDLDSDFAALRDSLSGAIAEQVIVAEGAVAGTYFTPWGAEADAIARDGISVLGFSTAQHATPTVSLTPVVTAARGARVGALTLSDKGAADADGAEDGADDQTVTLVLDRSISDPGPLWRLLSPGVVVPSFLSAITGSG